MPHRQRAALMRDEDITAELHELERLWDASREDHDGGSRSSIAGSP